MSQFCKGGVELMKSAQKRNVFGMLNPFQLSLHYAGHYCVVK